MHERLAKERAWFLQNPYIINEKQFLLPLYTMPYFDHSHFYRKILTTISWFFENPNPLIIMMGKVHNMATLLFSRRFYSISIDCISLHWSLHCIVSFIKEPIAIKVLNLFNYSFQMNIAHREQVALLIEIDDIQEVKRFCTLFWHGYYCKSSIIWCNCK